MTLLYYNFITEFKRQYYQGALGLEHLQGEEIEIKKLSLPDGGVDEEANFWGYVLKKDGSKYLLSSYKLDLQKDLPIIPKITEKVAYRGQVYYLIRKHNSIKIRPDKKLSFRELVDKLTYFKHSNPTHQTLLALISLTQLLDKANFRTSTPPSFGKDSSILVANYLFGGSSSIVSPTIPKLEFLSTILKWLAVNEVVDLTVDQWRNIEQFLLDVGDGKPEITKHSRGFGNVGETIDVSTFSLSLFYNDINSYPDPYKYVDFVAKKAVLDRFPAFRLFGTIKEDFNAGKNLDVNSWVTQNIEQYKEILHTYSYYQKNYLNERKFYKTNVEWKFENGKEMPDRWRININKLLIFVELYSNSQEEYDKWCKLILSSLLDYQEMLKFPKAFEECVKRHPKDTTRINYLLGEKNLFKDKIALLRDYSKTGNINLSDDKLW
jgi:hypothetical protein